MHSRDRLNAMPEWVQWLMGLIASATSAGLVGVVLTIRDQGERLVKVESETARLPIVEALLRDVRENVSAIRARVEDRDRDRDRDRD